MRGQRALRRGDLKYVRTSGTTDRLYDLATDEREQADLAAKRPGDLAELRAAWEAVDATLLPYSS
jgi:arylsulfatase A-like enzyme